MFPSSYVLVYVTNLNYKSAYGPIMTVHAAINT